jgi:DNA-directed RNA polymerase subunit RPC12/RpoP
MNKTQQEWKTTTTKMDSFIQNCDFYDNGICEGHNDKFRDKRFIQCKNCTRQNYVKRDYCPKCGKFIAYGAIECKKCHTIPVRDMSESCNSGKCDIGENMNDGHYFKLKCNNCKQEFEIRQQLKGIICPKCNKGILYWIPNNQ